MQTNLAGTGACKSAIGFLKKTDIKKDIQADVLFMYVKKIKNRRKLHTGLLQD